MRDLDQQPLQLVEQARHPRLARAHDRLPVEAVRAHQLLRVLLLGGDVDGLAVRARVDELDQQHLRPLEVVADGDEQDALARGRGDGRRRGRRVRPVAAEQNASTSEAASPRGAHTRRRGRAGAAGAISVNCGWSRAQTCAP